MCSSTSAPASASGASETAMEQSLFTSILFATIVAGTPLIITALGELVTEKSGVLNLGAEGTMAVGAIVAFAVTHHTHSAWLGILAGMGAGILMSLIFAFLAPHAHGQPVGRGAWPFPSSAPASRPSSASPTSPSPSPARPPSASPGLASIPYIGPALFKQQALVYFSWIMLGPGVLVPLPHPRGPDPAGRGRVPGLCPRHRASRRPDPLPGDHLRRRHGGRGRRLHVRVLHADVGGGA